MTRNATDLADCSATELLALYASKQASPVLATQAVLERIARLNPSLNAFCHLAPEEALRRPGPASGAGCAANPAGRSMACPRRSKT